MLTQADYAAARREGRYAARTGFPWDANPYTRQEEALLHIEWHVGWWEMKRFALAEADAWREWQRERSPPNKADGEHTHGPSGPRIPK